MKKVRICAVIFFAAVLCFCFLYNTAKSLLCSNEAPVITVQNSEMTVSISAGDEELLSGVSAYDKSDGDVTESLIVKSLSKFDERGYREICYAAFDSDGNVADACARIKYSDYVSPQIKITQPLICGKNSKMDFSDYFSCTDCLDGDLSHKIKITYNSDEAYDAIYSGGIFKLTAEITNSCGDTTSISAYMEVYAQNYEYMVYTPQLQLTDYTVYLNKNDVFDAQSYLKCMIIGDDEYTFGTGENSVSPRKITITSDVNTAEAGQYSVRYSYTSSAGYKGSVVLVVVVCE